MTVGFSFIFSFFNALLQGNKDNRWGEGNSEGCLKWDGGGCGKKGKQGIIQNNLKGLPPPQALAR